MAKVHVRRFILMCAVFVFFTVCEIPRLYGQNAKSPKESSPHARVADSIQVINSSSFEQGLVKPRIAQQIITVGGPNADIAGYSSEAIQIAADALKTQGGGTIKLGPGTYQIMAPIRLSSFTNLIGAGPSTVLHKVEGFRSRFVVDADYGMLKLTVEDVSGFREGMGIQVSDATNRGCWSVTTAKITAIEGNAIYIDNYLVRDYKVGPEGVVSNACSLVEVVEAEGVVLANFVIDGNKETNDRVNGCRGGGIYMHKARGVLIENVVVRNFNGDGIDGQITEGITITNCQVYNCTGLGFHPGTGSDRPTIEGCTSHDNGSDGIYLCWRVQNGVFRNNTVYNNGRDGISIGHKDTDNIFENNHIYENARHGVNFRNEDAENAGHRNKFYNNLVENNGTKEGGYGFYIDGAARDIIVENNTIRDTAKGLQKAGVYITERPVNTKLSKNRISGHTDADIIDKSAKTAD